MTNQGCHSLGEEAVQQTRQTVSYIDRRDGKADLSYTGGRPRILVCWLVLMLLLPISGQPASATVNCATQTYYYGATSESECKALVALYEATNGPEWTNKTGWDGSNPDRRVCNFYGVKCNLFGQVIELRLPSNNLSGKIPPEIGNLTWLNTLYLYNNQFHISILKT